MISVCIIAKNEEAVLMRCIDSVKGLADEIIVLDTGSTDATRDIARGAGAKVFEAPWENNFAKAKNECMDHATEDYVLFLDADETFIGNAEALKDELRKIPMMGAYAGIMCISSIQEYITFKIAARGHARWRGKIHEHLAPIPPFATTQLQNLRIMHLPPPGKPNGTERNLRIIKKALEDAPVEEPDLVSRYTFYYARELFDNQQWEEAIKYFRKYLDIGNTWIAERFNAACRIAECHLKMGQYRELRRACFEAIEIEPTWIDSYILLGFAAHIEHKWRELAGWCRMALTMADNPCPLFDNISYRKDAAHRNLGVALWWLREYKESEYHLLKALQYSPGNLQILGNLKLLEGKVRP